MYIYGCIWIHWHKALLLDKSLTSPLGSRQYDPPVSQGSSFAEDQVPQFGFECFHERGLGSILEISGEIIVTSADLECWFR